MVLEPVNKVVGQGIPRGIEIFLAGCGLLLAAPVLAVSAVLIKMGSAGPVFFRQERVGRLGKSFNLLKLRSMMINQGGSMVTAGDDIRITSVGKILRKTKIDELPCFWNVLRGDMSFVGPRPEVPALVDLNDLQWREILTVRPGITDPVTLRLRNEENLLAEIEDKEQFYREVLQPYKLRGYLDHVRNKNWRSDIRIISQTLKTIVLPNTAIPPTTEELTWSRAE